MSLVHSVGWLVVLGLKALCDSISSISGRLPKRGRKRKERIDESKNIQTTPSRTYCEHSRPLPYSIQIVGRPGTRSLPSTIAPPDHPLFIRDSTGGNSLVLLDTPRDLQVCHSTLFLKIHHRSNPWFMFLVLIH